MIYLNQGKDYFWCYFRLLYMKGPSKVPYKNMLFIGVYLKKKAINVHFSFNLSNSLFNQKLIAYTTLKI